MLFGESSFPQNEANPLICSKKKFEAQTEIVVAQKTIEGFGNEPVFTDEEED